MNVPDEMKDPAQGDRALGSGRMGIAGDLDIERKGLSGTSRRRIPRHGRRGGTGIDQRFGCVVPGRVIVHAFSNVVGPTRHFYEKTTYAYLAGGAIGRHFKRTAIGVL